MANLKPILLHLIVFFLFLGATGFMGKILIEKLLVSCPGIGNLYLLIREKKGKSFEERFDTLFKDDVSIFASM